MIHTVKGFGIVNKAERDVFLELSCFFDDPVNVDNLISGSSAFSKTSLNIWKFTVHILLKPGLGRILSITLLACEMSATVRCLSIECWALSIECNVWAFFGIACLWDYNENWPFPVLWPLLSFPNLLAYWVQHFHASSSRFWNSSTEIPSPPLALFIVMLPKAHLTLGSRMSGSRLVITS